MMTNLSKILPAYRQKYDLTQKQIAEEIGITVSRVSAMENGKVPDFETGLAVLMWLVKNVSPVQTTLGVE